MLRLTATWTEQPSSRLFRRRRPRYIDVDLEGDTEGLTSVQASLAKAAETGMSHLDVTEPQGSRIEFILGVGELQVLPLADGIAIFGDDRAMSEVSRAVGYCLQNGAAGTPLDGYHHHIDLHNELDDDPIGDVTVYWRVSNEAS
ncbi:MAG: hypothetical protein ACJ76O_08685 [Gaiellaceae bacterium]